MKCCWGKNLSVEKGDNLFSGWEGSQPTDLNIGFIVRQAKAQSLFLPIVSV